MTAIVCPSCNSNLKAPEKLAGKTASCPKCRTAIVVPTVNQVGLTLSDPKTNRPALPAADAETIETMALEATAEQASLRQTVQTISRRAGTRPANKSRTVL